VEFFAIRVGENAVGGVGYTLREDVERVSAEIGYRLGAAHSGHGVVTSAVVALTRLAFSRRSASDLRRAVHLEHGFDARAREGRLPA
jgi:RimJ/RimL family protein N-acetyltransferase